MTCEEVAQKLECSASKISRVENGRASASPADVRDLLEIYGASPAQRKQLVQLARDSRQQGWWDSYKDAIEPHFATYLGLESAATEIRTYEVGLIPGLLQTEEYARAAISIGMLTSQRGSEDRLVELAMARQPTLQSDHPPQFWAVLDEASIRRQVGGPAVMRRQLEHLLEMARLPHVQIQLIPFSGGAHPAMGRSFVILSFGDSAAHDVVYLEDLTSGLYLEDATEVDWYSISFDHLRAAALPLTDSAALITDVAGTAAQAMAPLLAEVAAAARSARAKSAALRARNAAMADALAETQDCAAGLLDRLAERNPGDARLQARSVAARHRAARQRQRAADLRRGGPR